MNNVVKEFMKEHNLTTIKELEEYAYKNGNLLKESTLVTDHEYNCDAYPWLDNSEIERMTFSEAKAFIKARRNNGKIKPGQRYIEQYIWYGGYCFVYCHVFRAIPELHQICLKYDIYED
jgi:hypothetical protein